MSNEVAAKLQSLRALYTDQPDRAISADHHATAKLGPDLRCEVEGPNGATFATAMSPGIGGDGSGPSPGWFLRGAIASCAATTIALHAAEAGIELDALEVRVDSTSDGRGLLGDETVRPGMLEARLTVNASTAEGDSSRLEEVIAAADLGSPVGESLRTGVRLETTITVD